MRITLTPCINKRLQLILGKAHIKSPHCLKCSNRPAVAKCELCDFALLTQMTVYAVLFNRNLKHLTGRCTVNIPAVDKYLSAPILAGKPGYHPGFDCREISNIEFQTFRRNKSGTNKL